MDANNYNLGLYIAYAVNDPKKYPKEPFLKKAKATQEQKEMTADAMKERAKLLTKLFGGKVKKKNG